MPKVWVAHSKHDYTDIIGVFTTQENAAAYYVARYGGKPEDADVEGFDIWQFPPKKQVYYVATALAWDGASRSDPFVVSQEVWKHQSLELPADTALGWVQGRYWGPSDEPGRMISVMVYDWQENGLRERASTWLNDLLALTRDEFVE